MDAHGSFRGWRAASVLSQEEKASQHLGYWGEITGTLDWCEENYLVTLYVAEWWNTLSNMGMVFLSILGVYLAAREKFPLSIKLMYLALLGVGIGSAVFHGTLQWYGQLLDELPMLWGNSILFFNSHHKERRDNNFISCVLFSVVYGVGVTAIYLYNHNAVFFETSYGLGVAFLIYTCTLYLKKYDHPELRILVTRALAYYGFAFFVWNIDNNFCGTLRSLRYENPLAPVFQFHAHWHWFAGFGTYHYMIFTTFIHMLEQGKEVDLKYIFWIIPYVSARHMKT
uniref:Alkaline ceramidase n=1 Tax=Aplanochytrium stocchinoi TaxID=215587 RepID=A0A7S3PPY8_9STRA|mmetsp:Transcript_16135/g.20682  ORF Transcript_16135/g.20682 Transcript_16135/m.20682 type:complete len:283 (+) Transcript_16135:141-989(+)|eukprot:CAMPEP_0204874718 /NCGR_PEP_ID=MMETSP1348-20121228/43886_1 /ASSEMBLY_ACC=CAM_ASM_000700 /TAXON_ID=215587 /ORGANISM="Aplanochytrium stocchinoi, Strain GSBS06" /LENGTH=282 /DNA_ID=CAMNT_0052030701 /DNA_START=57 /DNA_END=905 /DNA_ORIENTATION=+